MKAIFTALLLTVDSAFAAEIPLKVELSEEPLSVTFTNTGDKPLRILKPLDGSEWSWIMPHYKLTVADARDQQIPLRVRCGLFGHPYSGTKWPDDYSSLFRSAAPTSIRYGPTTTSRPLALSLSASNTAQNRGDARRPLSS